MKVGNFANIFIRVDVIIVEVTDKNDTLWNHS